jgi:hypothetical protein
MGSTDVHFGDRTRVFVQLQSGMVFGRNGGPRPSQDQDTLDFCQAFAGFTVIRGKEKPKVELKIGRQELNYGEGSLLAIRELNVRRPFDGVKAIIRPGDWRIDLLAFRPTLLNKGSFDDGIDSSQELWGTWARRTRYQQGSVQREKRQSGADVWVFRWWESTFDGTSKRRKAIVGTVEAFPTEASALKAAKALRIDANQQTPHSEGGPETVAELVAHYRLKELVGENQGRKSFSTRAGYESYLNGWILPRWGDHRLEQVKSVAVEEWLDSIKRAKGTRAKIRNIMSAIFHHAMRYEWVERNPIKLVRQSAKRERTPDILELVGCRSEFVTTDSSGGVGVLPSNGAGICRVGVDISPELSRQV